MDLEPERLLAALRKIRIGYVAAPPDRDETSRATSDSTATDLSLLATVPDWLIRSLDTGQDAPRVRLEVFSLSLIHISEPTRPY